MFSRLAFDCVERAAQHRPGMDDVVRRLLTVKNVIRGVRDDAVDSTGGLLKTELMYTNSDLGVDASLGSESLTGTNFAPPVSTIYGAR